jgi:hypothetical protein
MLILYGILSWIVFGIYIFTLTSIFDEPPTWSSDHHFLVKIPAYLLGMSLFWGGFACFWIGFGGEIGNEAGGEIAENKVGIVGKVILGIIITFFIIILVVTIYLLLI